MSKGPVVDVSPQSRIPDVADNCDEARTSWRVFINGRRCIQKEYESIVIDPPVDGSLNRR